MCIASSDSMQQYIQFILELRASNHILEFEHVHGSSDVKF